MRNIRAVLLCLTAFMLLIPGLASAQDLGQALFWPEAGLTLNYPTGWFASEPEEDEGMQGRFISQDPDIDMNSSDMPTAPTVAVIAIPSSLVDMMGGDPETLLQIFASEFGGTSTQGEVMIGGLPGIRASAQTEEDGTTFDIELAMVSTEQAAYVFVGISPTGQSIKATLDGMLNTVIFSEPTGLVDPLSDIGGGMAISAEGGVPVDAVRVTMDQALTGSWNEIDAVELVGADADGFEVNQWGISAEATSSYGEKDWSANQAVGEPNTLECGDYVTSWASATSTGYDSLTVHYGMPVAASAVNIHQTYNPGAIVMVELLPADGSDPIVIFEGVDTTTECPGVMNIPVEVSGGSFGTTLDYSLAPNYGELTLAAGFADDPQMVSMAAGGDVDMSVALSDQCFEIFSGYSTPGPDVRLQYTAGTYPLSIYFDSAGGDTVLAVNAPDGSWLCSDDGINFDGLITFDAPASGQYDIWVGTFSAGETLPGTLYVTEQAVAGDTGSGASGASLDYSLTPSYGEVSLVSGFAEDPHMISMTAGGDADIYGTAGGDCTGYASAAPSARLQYTAGDYLLRVFFASAGEDTVLAVNAPDGSWLCSDDADGTLDGMVEFNPPVDGQYDIWVGTFSMGDAVPGTLYITEQVIGPGSLTPSK